MSVVRREKCSWMNDSKWATVLDALVTRRILCRIKLLWHDYADSAVPGAPVITAYDSYGRPFYLEPEVVWRTTPSYWEGGGTGPFRRRDIEWLALPTREFEAIRPELPENLKIVSHAEETVILGYEFE